MRTSKCFALKLTDYLGRTFYGKRKLSIGVRVPRRHSDSYTLVPCSKFAVHAYRNLTQARVHDRYHCRHGGRGVLWLVLLYRPTSIEDKLLGTNYRVLAKLGRMRDVKAPMVAKAIKRFSGLVR